MTITEINDEIYRLKKLRDRVIEDQVVALQNNVGSYFIISEESPDGSRLVTIGRISSVSEYGFTRCKALEFSEEGVAVGTKAFTFEELQEEELKLISRSEAEDLIAENFEYSENVARRYLISAANKQ